MVRQILLPLCAFLIATTVFAESRCTVDDPVAEQFKPNHSMSDFLPADDALLRIRLDFNGDGLEDVAVTPRGSCGMKTCGWWLYLKCSNGKYRAQGDVGLELWYGFRVLISKNHTFKIENCMNSVKKDNGTRVIDVCGYNPEKSSPCDLVRKIGDFFEVGETCSNNDSCPVPNSTLGQRVYDLCFWIHETDDIAHPGVNDCYQEKLKLPDTCGTRILLKRERCKLLGKAETQTALKACQISEETEGYFVRGCQYPFDEKCIIQFR